MNIRTSEKEYPIVGIKEQKEKYDVYICRDPATKELCSILSVKDCTLFPVLANWLTDNAGHDSFTDYRGFFIFNDQFCIVTKYSQGITLGSKLTTESVPLRERLEIGRKILEKIILQDIPDYFLSKCLSPDQIIIDNDLSVSFNYPVSDMIFDRSADGKNNIVSIFRLIFEHELLRKVPDILIDFITRLPELSQNSMIDLYSEYYILMNKLENYSDNDELPKTFWFKAWDVIKKIFKVLKVLLVIALIIASVGYLIYTIIDPDKNKNSNGHFPSIGTVTIENSG